MCMGASNESSKALSSSAVPLGSPRSSTSLPAHFKFNAHALRPAHSSSQCLGVSGRERERRGGRARARERRVREREGGREGESQREREEGGRERRGVSDSLSLLPVCVWHACILLLIFHACILLLIPPFVSSSLSVSCMHPPPHMTCMHPPPHTTHCLFFTVCVPLNKQNERVSGTCRTCNREHILSLQRTYYVFWEPVVHATENTFDLENTLYFLETFHLLELLLECCDPRTLV